MVAWRAQRFDSNRSFSHFVRGFIVISVLGSNLSSLYKPVFNECLQFFFSYLK